MLYGLCLTLIALASAKRERRSSYGSESDDSSSSSSSSSSGGGMEYGNHKHTCRAGFIQMFFGSEDDVPKGWQICDGSNKTPDMRDRFPVASGDAFPYYAVGGDSYIT
jgi:hypothetical protein